MKDDNTITRMIARHVADVDFVDLPVCARAAARRSILDMIGIMAPAVSVDSASKALSVELLAREPEGEKASVIGLGRTASPMTAAFLNGCFAQSLDYGDTVDATGHHPTAQALPAALAVAQAYGASGAQFLTAIALAQDVGIRLAGALSPSVRKRSPWFTPTLIGPFTAMLAAGKVLALDEAQIVNLLGIALHRSHGVLKGVIVPESQIRANRYGLVAQDGVMGALLARAGVTGYARGVEELYNQFFDSDYDRDALIEKLGETFLGRTIALKAWPCCRATQGYVDSIRSLVVEHSVMPDQVAGIVLHASEITMDLLVRQYSDENRRPKSSIQSKMSLPFTADLAILKEPSFGDFADNALGNADVLSLADRVVIRPDPNCGQIQPTTASIHLLDGRQLTRTCHAIRGAPECPLSEAELHAKFADCMEVAGAEFGAERIADLIAVVSDLENHPDMRALTSLLP